MNADPRVDAYIAKATAFAQPILTEVRARIKKACPAAEETIKWHTPFYLLEGKILASMAAFTHHAKVGIWAETKPEFTDVTTLAELPSAKDYVARLHVGVQRLSGCAKPSKAAATKKPATKVAANKRATLTRNVAANKSAATTPPAKKLGRKVAAPEE